MRGLGGGEGWGLVMCGGDVDMARCEDRIVREGGGEYGL